MPNLVDPTGEQSECLPEWFCKYDLLPDSLSEWCKTECSESTPLDALNALESAVLIELGYEGCSPNGTSCNCKRDWIAISQGTITENDTIWTHDHYVFVDYEAFDRAGVDAVRASSYPASDAEQSLRYIQHAECVEFRGAFGSLAMPTSNLSTGNIVRTIDGAMKLRIPGIGNIGHAVREPIQSLISGDRLYLAIMLPNYNDCVSERTTGNRICQHSELQAIEAPFTRYGNIPDVDELDLESGEWTLPGGYFTSGETSQGSSGAGIIHNGRIVGVNYGGSSTGRSYFVPITP